MSHPPTLGGAGSCPLSPPTLFSGSTPRGVPTTLGTPPAAASSPLPAAGNERSERPGGEVGVGREGHPCPATRLFSQEAR
jgi:hypothetical protein